MPTVEEIPPPPPPTQLVKPVTAGQAMKILGKFQPEATPAGNESPTEAAPSSAAAMGDSEVVAVMAEEVKAVSKAGTVETEMEARWAAMAVF